MYSRGYVTKEIMFMAIKKYTVQEEKGENTLLDTYVVSKRG